MSKIVNRSDKVAFWKITSGSTTKYVRMTGFTELSKSMNAIEYSRKYVDEQFEQTDVTGYSPEWSFAFDDYTDNAVLADIKDIFKGEKIGTEAVRTIVFADFSEVEEDATSVPCVKRDFSVICDAEADGDDAYTYSGTFKCKGAAVNGTGTIAAFENVASVSEITEFSGN